MSGRLWAQWAVLGVVLVALAVRWVGLGDFMTVDEERWIIRSSDYYENIFDKKDFGGAFQTTHPGATAMWLMGAGVRVQELRLGYKADESNIADFKRVAKIPIAVAVSALIGVTVWVLMSLVGTGGAVVAGSLLALDPYLVGMSQVAHLDALLSLLMLVSILLFLRGAGVAGRRFDKKYLIGAGVAAGLALATKGLPALWIGVIWGVVVLHLGWRERLKFAWAWMIRCWFLAAGVAVLALYITWPALWFTADLGRSVTRDYGNVITDEHVAIELSEEPIAPASFYVRSLAGRLTPVVLIVSASVLIVVVYVVVRRRRMSVAGLLLVYGLGFVGLISMAAKKGDRYALPAMVALIVVAGIGLWVAGQFAWGRYAMKRRLLGGVVAVVGLALVGQWWAWQPYAISYTNPLFPNVRPLTQQGWGEGLGVAAAWLNERPFIDRLTIASWYPSVMGVFFDGKTFSLSSREDHRVGYVVLYRNMGDRAADDIASNVLDEFGVKEPVKVFSIGGVPYVWVYDVLGPFYFPTHVGEITEHVEVGQIVPIERDGWSTLDLSFATFSGRNNTEDVVVEIKDSPDSEAALRRMVINARNIPDEEWVQFDFDPISESAGKTYYVAVTSPTSVAGNAVTVRLAPEDVKPGQAVVRRERLQDGQKQSDFVRDGDLGYRVGFAE